MKKVIARLLLPLLVVQTSTLLGATHSQEAAKSIQQSQESVTPLSNQDIIRMVQADFTPATIVAQIRISACDFVTTPAALQQLKEEAVADAVILAMVMAPKSGPIRNHSSTAIGTPKNVSVRIPNGLMVEVETPFAVSSQDVREGDLISFRVVNPVKVDGIIVIEKGSTATARVIKASRGGHFGRAGRLAWTMRDVTAVDGTRIALQASGRIVGDSKAAKVATQMILTGAVFWVLAPVALLRGFKRGENAILPAGKRVEVFVQGDATVNATAPADR